jgi:hypothetical protein
MTEERPRRIVGRHGIFLVTYDKEEDRYYLEMEEKRGLTFEELGVIRTLMWEAHLSENRTQKE